MRYRSTTLSLLMGLALMFVSSAALAQYHRHNLDSNQVGKAQHTDPLIVNAWGLVHGPGTPWWVSDNNSGWSTLYDGGGHANQHLKVLIPTAGSGLGNGAGSPTGNNGPGSPTGVVFNNSSDPSEFQVDGWQSFFLFATVDGTISGWAPQANFNSTLIAVDNFASKASYTGLAITNRASNNRLYAADQVNNKIDVYNGNFTPVVHAGAFTDPNIPAGFSVFGIQDINGEVYVTYASTTGGSGGFVDEYTEDGVLVSKAKPLISGAPLNQPWGIAAAPRNFGPLSNTLLISNNINQDGTINAFDPTTGTFVGTVRDAVTGKPIFIDQLWGIGFGDGTGANGASNALFFTSGPSNNFAGTFGSITF
jgi:uncharacterized protein (TIGR03118 family)